MSDRGGLACVTPDSRPNGACGGEPTGYLWWRYGDRNDHWGALIARDRTWASWRTRQKREP